MSSRIYELCREYTPLTDSDIEVIEAMQPSLQLIANMVGCDVFIDCITEDKSTAIVICEANPENVPSAYAKSVVGMLARKEDEPAVERTIRLGIGTKYVKAVTQERTEVMQNVEPIFNDNRIIGVLITEKRAVEEAESIENEKPRQVNVFDNLIHEYDWLMQYIDEALIMVDDKGKVCFRNMMAKELYAKLGYGGDILEMPYENILLHQPERVYQPGELEKTGIEVTVGKYFLRVKQIPLDKNGIQFAIVLSDITHLREKEKELVNKSVALKEMHHRIKNNFQMIASILRMQSRRSDNAEVKEVLEDTINRLLSISVTHELILQGEDDNVNIYEVVESIKRDLLRSYIYPDLEVNIDVIGDEFKLNADVASSVTLVINELLQNSFKYAFTDVPSGHIIIEITHGKMYSQVSITDNGKGFAVDEVKRKSLGLYIVDSVVREKLHGKFKIKSGPEGTKASFDFKMYN